MKYNWNLEIRCEFWYQVFALIASYSPLGQVKKPKHTLYCMTVVFFNISLNVASLRNDQLQIIYYGKSLTGIVRFYTSKVLGYIHRRLSLHEHCNYSAPIARDFTHGHKYSSHANCSYMLLSWIPLFYENYNFCHLISIWLATHVNCKMCITHGNLMSCVYRICMC